MWLYEPNSQLSHRILRKWTNAKTRKKLRKILKEGRKVRQSSAVAQASSPAISDTINDNADSICWFCHADVSNLANNKCVGCRKVKTHLCHLYKL